MYPLPPPGPALRKSNSQNIAAARPSQQGTARHHRGGGCRYSLPRSKASATVSLTNASANASCITTAVPSFIPPVHLPSPRSPRPRHTKKNVIPFPSSSSPCHSVPAALDITMEDPFIALLPTPTPAMFPQSGLGSDIGLNDALSRYQQQPYRRRRSPPQQQQQQQQPYPHWNTHPTPNPNIRKHPNSSPSPPSAAPAPRSKRPRKNKRVIADLHFIALVHRSIVNRVRESGVDITVYPDGGDSERMQVDGDHAHDHAHAALEPGTDHIILFGQEDLLLRRLWTTLVENGYGSEDDLRRVRFVSSDPDLDSEAETSMDVDSPDSEVLRFPFPLIPPGLAHPHHPSSTPTPTPPTPTNSPNPNPNPNPPAPIIQVLSMPQLVAALIMRYRYRPTGRDRERERERERGRRPASAPAGSGSGSGIGIGPSLFGRWKESFSLGPTPLRVDSGRGAGRGARGDAAAPPPPDVGGGNGRRRASPLSCSVFNAADEGWSLR